MPLTAQADPTYIVIDTNVLLDLFVFDDPRAQSLRAALAARQVVPVRSTDTDDELIDVLARPQFSLPTERQAKLVRYWQEGARLVSRVFTAPWQCTDPRDQKFLDLAHTARVTVLLTKDKAVLKVSRRARRDGLLIQTPATWSALQSAE